MNKYNHFIFWEDNVRLARQHFIMKFIPKTIAKQEFPDYDFRFPACWSGRCVLAPDHRHIITSGFRIMNICHEPYCILIFLPQQFISVSLATLRQRVEISYKACNYYSYFSSTFQLINPDLLVFTNNKTFF